MAQSPSPLQSTIDDVFPTATPTPNLMTTTTEEDPLQRHLALIVGVPTGFFLALILLSACVLWLMCSAYCENKKHHGSGAGSGAAGTHSTNVATGVS